jgi:hypothetical protein
MTTISQFQKEFDTFSATYTPDTKKSQLKALQYILQVAAHTNTNITRWDIVALFGTGTDKILVEDKNQINKKFFERLTTSIAGRIEKEEEKSKEVPKDLMDAILKATEKIQDIRKRALQDKMSQDIYHAKNANAQLNAYLIELNRTRNEMMNLGGENMSETFRKEFVGVLKDGCWVDPLVENGFLYLNTKNNVTISQINKAAKLDLTADLGQLAVKINLEDFNMWVIPYKNNIRARDHYHPHVSSDGRICWGDALTQSLNWMKEGKIANILKVLYSLLFNYNPGNPYVEINAFVNSQKVKYGRCPDSLLHPGRLKKTKEEEEEELAELTELQRTMYAPARVR